MSIDYLHMKVADLQKLKKKRKIFIYFLERIKKYDRKYKAFIEVLQEKEAIPYGLKDNILCLGSKTTCASKLLKNFNSTYNASVVENLKKYGFEPIGKTNLDEFAMGSSTENSSFFHTKNPWNINRIPGGSSGGSAVAVASGLVPFSLGSDTGGSVRLPASMCGVIGYKPSYGLVSRYGLVSFASSFDQIGIFSRCTEDVHSVLKMISANDEKDSSKEFFLLKNLEEINLKTLKVAVPEETINYMGLDDRVKNNFFLFINDLEKKGVNINYVKIPSFKYAIATYYLLSASEASSNLARYDGIRYGERNKKNFFCEMVNKFRDEGFGIEVKRRILLGTFTLSNTSYNQYYSKALKVRNLMKKDLNKLFKEYDFIINPTSPVIAPRINEVSDPLSLYLMDYFTVMANLIGAPAISIPIKRIINMPIGLQIMSKRFSDNELLSFTNSIQELSPSFKDGFFELTKGYEENV